MVDTESKIIIDISSNIDKYDDKTDLDFIEKYIKNVLDENYLFDDDRAVYISILLTDNCEIQDINREYRGKDSPTDVISFADHEGEEVEDIYDTLGDIVISLEKVEEQAIEYGHSYERELYYVLTHGILHLLGYDHIDEVDKIEMRKKEEEILEKYNFRRD